MYRKANILFLYCQTPLHAGSGDSLGIVDLPIQRERHTSFPKIEASSLKGSLREHFERKNVESKKIIAAFGSEDNNEDNSQAGCFGVTDARILLFPVKSAKGVFAWITCPKILSKFKEELKLAGIEADFDIPKENSISEKSSLLTSKNSVNIILEEFTFYIKPDKNVEKLGIFLQEKIFSLNDNSYFAEKLTKDIAVLSDDDFRDFVNLSTEVITRTRIDNVTGTVEEGALFTEEYLPAESILYSLALTAPEFAEESKKIFKEEEDLRNFVKEFLDKNNILQIGGNQSLGKGIVKVKFIPNSAKTN